jgi:restriction system-associated AAA family ATPase
MRILSLKLLTEFRGLKAGAEFKFDHEDSGLDRIEPICLVGINGSGKSNLLEVICEIFYYLDDYVLSEGKPIKDFKTPFGFEISYSLDITFQLARSGHLEKIQRLNWEGTRDTNVRVIKEAGELPFISLYTKDKTFVENDSDPEVFILPNHIIAYSSGQNELLSNPYIKASYRYFQLLDRQLSNNTNFDLGLNRLFFLDYDSCQLALLCNYLFAELNNVSLITGLLELDKERPLDSFRLTIRFKNYRNNSFKLPLAIENAILNLKACATIIEEEQDTNGNRSELRLAYYFDSELRKAFQRKFGSAIALYRDLYYLKLLNIHLHPVDTRTRIKNAPSATYDNLSNLIPVPPINKLVFNLDKVRLRKKSSGEIIKYRNLSDGEHQMMHVLGSVILLNTSGSILLYDEPETHFNPQWRSKLITLINSAAREKQQVDRIRKQEIVITSHSPFIVSDCRKERVFIFEKGKCKNPDVNTFGASVNLITHKIFGQRETIATQSLSLFKMYLSRYRRGGNVKEILDEVDLIFGDSVEKTLFVNDILEQEDNKKKQKSRNK